jgi:hypothetical protein
MWGKPALASVEETGDWFAIPLSRPYDYPSDMVGPFASEAVAWDWLEACVRDRDEADGGIVLQAMSPTSWEQAARTFVGT